MSGDVLLDTNIVSFLAKGDSRAVLYGADLKDRRLCISFITVGELRLWGKIRNWGSQRIEEMEHSLRSYVVVPFDDRIATEWAEIAAAEIRAGRDRQNHSDWWIAACAIRHSIPLVSHDTKDFAGIDRLTLITHPDAPPTMDRPPS